MKEKLTEQELSAFLPHIFKVIKTGKSWEDPLLHYPVEAIVNAVLSISGMQRERIEDGSYGVEGFDTNGWQWDWWQKFTRDGKRYTLSGSGYYGGHSFYLSDV